MTRYFQIYMTNDGYDFNQPLLKWSDLESKPFCEINSVTLDNGRYKLQCKLPAGKMGRRIIYTIWQRNDSAEAFYACSDVIINAVKTTWRELRPLPTTAQDQPAGMKITLRVFDPDGHDLESISYVVTAQTTAAADWVYAMAQKINTESKRVHVGLIDNNGNIVPQTSAAANRIYVDGPTDYNFVVDYTGAATPTPAPAPMPTPAPTPSPGAGGACAVAWQSGTPYKAKEQVSSNGHNYSARWETTDDPSRASGNGKPWKDLGACSGQTALTCAPAWSASKTYANAGTSVSYNGMNYRNKWWTANNDSATNADGAWEKVGPCK